MKIKQHIQYTFTLCYYTILLRFTIKKKNKNKYTETKNKIFCKLLVENLFNYMNKIKNNSNK